MADIIVDLKIVSDTWTAVADAAPLPEGDIIVSRSRWLTDADALRARGGKVGARFASTENPMLDGDALTGLDLVALEFPKFADGRAYTYARQLRQRVGFEGQIRAVGDVLHDQLRYLWRCGFNAFELNEGVSLDYALKAFGEFTIDYQPTTPNAV